MKKWMTIVACLVGVAACGDSANSLSGSISEEYNLDFNSVQLATSSPYVIVSYIGNPDPAVAKTAKLVVDTTGLTVMPGKSIDLTEIVNNNPRGTLQRIEQTTINFPIKMGSVVFDTAPVPNSNLSGHFAATLSMPDGRTLDGTFSGTLIQQ